MVKMETIALPFMWIEIVHRLRCILIRINYDALVTIPPFTYYKEVRIFHKNGVLKKEGKRLFCSSIDIGIWREYDNQGNLIKETDEDKKFEKLHLKPINILRWLEKEGYIDRKTGKGQEKFVKQGDEPGISISFGKISAPNAKFEKDSVLWTITITDKGGDITSEQRCIVPLAQRNPT